LNSNNQFGVIRNCHTVIIKKVFQFSKTRRMRRCTRQERPCNFLVYARCARAGAAPPGAGGTGVSNPIYYTNRYSIYSADALEMSRGVVYCVIETIMGEPRWRLMDK
jgi:hypothetical protein